MIDNEAYALAQRIDNADFMRLFSSGATPDDDMVETPINADDHNLIVEALRYYGHTIEEG